MFPSPTKLRLTEQYVVTKQNIQHCKRYHNAQKDLDVYDKRTRLPTSVELVEEAIL
jgi:hypothetical protein